MRVQRRAEELDAFVLADFRVRHGIAERDGLVADAATRLGAPELEPPRRGGLVRRPVLAVHLVVSQLNDHLHVRIGAAAELLDQAFAIALVCLHAELVRADLAVEVAGRGFEVLLHLGVECPAQGLWLGEVGAYGGVAEVEGVGEDEHVCVVVEAVGGRAVHHGVLAHEAGCAVVVDYELEGLVVPSV